MGTAESQLMREGQTFDGQSLLSRYASLVKLPHTLFALPFAGVGVVLATYAHTQLHVLSLVWIVLAFTSARFAAMAFNRLVDRDYDAQNPRTAMRELPTGKLTVAQARVSIVIASLGFIACAWLLNPLCGKLSFVALAWVFFYSYAKRFTALSHYVLGWSLAISPVGAYLAVTGQWSRPWYALIVLALGVVCWVSGFDIVYAIQDIEFDRTTGLHSLPARLGVQRSLMLSRAMHLLSVLAFATIGALQLFPVGKLYVLAVTLMSGLLIYEHRLVSGPLDMRKIDRAFFKMNVIVSTSFFALTLLDRLLAS